MTTMFQAGFSRSNFFWMGNGGRGGRSRFYKSDGLDWPHRYCDPAMEWCPTPLVSPVPYPPFGAFAMGQAAQTIPTGTLTEDDRRAVIARIDDSIKKGTMVDNWIHTVGDRQKDVLGDQYGAFRGYVDYAADLAVDVIGIYDRLKGDNAEDWYVLDDEAVKIDQFLGSVENAYRIFTMKVTPAAGAPKPAPVMKPVTPPAKPAPKPGAPAARSGILQPSAPAISPLAIGIGAAAVAALIVVAVT